ncbi:helix-turn-helix transcriptional regulator [Patescibacteria group bacterium]
MTNRLKVLRAENDMTQEQLAEKLGVTRQTIISIESGRYTPSLPLAMKIGQLFDKSVEEIFISK